MAIIDYGALLRVNGKLVNRNIDFMEGSDTGYVCEKAVDKNEVEHNIKGNYFVYAGDRECLLVFYKGICKVIQNEKVTHSFWEFPFLSETIFLSDDLHLTVSKLSKNKLISLLESNGTWENYVKENWKYATGKESLSELDRGLKYYKKFLKRGKRIHYCNTHGGLYQYYPYRFLAEWNYKGNHYEVIFGYGIDSDEEVWNEIKNKAYNFSKEEIKLIDSWFEGE